MSEASSSRGSFCLSRRRSLLPWPSRSLPVAPFGALCRELGLGRREASLAYVRSRYPETCVVFGAETATQVRETVSAWSVTFPETAIGRVEEALRGVDGAIIDPSRWPI